MRQTILGGFLALLIGGVAALGGPDASARPIAFIHVNVVPMDRESVWPDQTVLIQASRISAIGPSASTPTPEDTRRIDAKGKYLMPGLADMHVHLARGDEADPEALVVFLAAGVTTVRNMWGEPIHLEWRRRINHGELLGPNIYSTGPITDGDPPFWPGSAVVKTPDEAAKEVAAQKRAGYDATKVFTNLSPESYYAILEAAKEHDLPVYGHVPIRVGLEKALTSGQKSFEHMVDFTYSLLPSDSPVLTRLIDMFADRSKRNWRGFMLDPREQANRSKIPELAAKAAAAGVWFCPTLTVHRHQAVDAAEFDQLRKDPGFAYVPPQKLNRWEMRAEFLTKDDRNDPAIMKRGFDTILIAVKALHDAGTHLIVGTDTPNPFVVPGFSVHQELEYFVKAGLTPYEALTAATHDAAEFVGALNEWGTVAVGRRADLILVDANPLDDVSNAAKQVGVMVRGRWYPKAKLQAKLDALAAKYARMKEQAARVTVIEHVNVVPMDGERVMADQTVLVRGDRIESIQPSARAEVPEKATRIPGHDKYLMPGLADMHVHFVGDEDQFTLFVANGVTTVRNMFGSPEHLEWRKRTKDGSLFGPTIYTTGPITDGDPPYWPGSAVVTTVEEAEKEVLSQKEAGYDGMKVFDNLQPDVYESILATAAKHAFPVYGHVPVRVGMERALGMGQRSFEHMNDFLYALIPSDDPVRVGLLEAAEDKTKVTLQTVLIQPFKSADANRIPQLVAKIVESNAWICPTLQLLKNMGSTAEEFKTIRKRPEIRYVAPENWAYWDRVETGLTSKQGDPAALKDAYKLALRSITAMHDAGARLVAGTDTPNPFLVPGFSLHEELQRFVDAGLTPYDALKAATHDAAELVGALDEWGTVGVGRRADLILVDANPLDDVANASKQVGVMVRGHWYPKTELQAKLDALAAKYARARRDANRSPEAASHE